MSIILDIYENFRKTSTDVKSKKENSKKRKYDYNAGFTGTKSKDYNNSKSLKDNER